jgi:hypothetical protein
MVVRGVAHRSVGQPQATYEYQRKFHGFFPWPIFGQTTLIGGMSPIAWVQPELAFTDAPADAVSGLTLWREQRAEALRLFARRAGVPIGRDVEVWLVSGIRLRGVLRLQDEELFFDAAAHDLALCVQDVPFRRSEMESCVALDQPA